MTSKEVTPTGFAERAFKEGLLSIDLETQEFKEATYCMIDSNVYHYVIPENSKVNRTTPSATHPLQRVHVVGR